MSADFDLDDDEDAAVELDDELDEAELDLGELGDDDVWGAAADDDV